MTGRLGPCPPCQKPSARSGPREVATEQKEQAEQDLADLLKKVASSKKDLEATQAAIVADEEFLANMRKD